MKQFKPYKEIDKILNTEGYFPFKNKTWPYTVLYFRPGFKTIEINKRCEGTTITDEEASRYPSELFYPADKNFEDFYEALEKSREKQETYPEENEITIDTSRLNPRIFNRLYNIKDIWTRPLFTKEFKDPYDNIAIVYIFKTNEDYAPAYTERELERFAFVDLTSLDRESFDNEG